MLYNFSKKNTINIISKLKLIKIIKYFNLKICY